MQQLNTWVIAIIGITLTIVAPEMEKKTKETTMIIKITNEIRENKILLASTISSAIRCKEKLNINLKIYDKKRKQISIDKTKTTTEFNKFKICEELKTKRIKLSKTFDNTLKQFAEISQEARILSDNNADTKVRQHRSINNNEFQATEIPTNSTISNPDKLINTESTNTTIFDDTQLTSNDTSPTSHQNKSDEMNNQSYSLNLTSVDAKSEKLMASSNISMINKLTEEKIENNEEASVDSIESPLIISNQPWPSRRLALSQKKIHENIINEDKLSYPRKDQSKPSINLVDSGKPSKIFYEIKPSFNTAMNIDDNNDDDDDFNSNNNSDNNDNVETRLPIISVTRKSFIAGFKLPNMPSSFGKFGPYFIDNVDHRIITERTGNSVILDCRIGLLGDKKVTWLQHDKDSIRLLTVGNVQYSADERISLKFQYPDNWRLQITYATLRDTGLYKCQVEIDPTRSLVKHYNVVITAPVLKITDDSGRGISGERHLKAGSTLRLKCEGRDVLEKLNESLLWTRGDETLTSDVSENRTIEIEGNKEIPIIISTLVVEKATSRHAGNYSCTVPERAKTTIAVHVLNGELPAAVHHGNGVSNAMLNLWLIHLTISYGFFR
ncbi:hypothetical protein HCN44_008583 [Aphidius gifuensis]|uniref:Ig-like domain-containing protein n=1 Tax=Aphidius gifuensis TaxID=684658 RepID=A0A835CMJ9_APHGI|nr:uncharacterized protein LOC122858311 [Aphidius gifuensis]KAF7989909.1 hypothetical protein HCN44_008583 [Aphidius gifuensis]